MFFIIKTIAEARSLDLSFLRETEYKKEKYDSQRFEINLNEVGRWPVLGHFVGVLRLIRGVVVAPLASIAAFFLLVGAGIARLHSKESCDRCLGYSKKCGKDALNGVLHIFRAVVEILPLTGYFLACYDIRQHIDGRWD